MAKVRFVASPQGLRALEEDPSIWPRYLEQVGARLGSEVQAQAPRVTGDFAGTIEVGTARLSGSGWGIEVGTSSAGSPSVEFGSINNPPYAPFRKAVSRLGLRLVEGRR